MRHTPPLFTVLLSAALACWASLAGAAQDELGVPAMDLADTPYTFDTAEVHGIEVSVIARDFERPFSMVFLPNGDLLVSERGLNLRLIRRATGPNPSLDPQPVAGMPTPNPFYRNGGLNDLALHPDFASNNWLYFTYNKPAPPDPDRQGSSSAVTLMRGRLDNNQLTNVEELFSGEFAGTSGSRLAFAQDGTIFITTGAPFGSGAQDLASVNGKVLRLNANGSIPADNPFLGRDDVHPAIYSFGHRDQLGLAIHPESGTVLAAEHGMNGGDEVNVILPGRNYGWPDYSYSRTYDGALVSDLPVAPGIERPLVLWSPSIAPSGMNFYSGDGIPAWKGNLFVASARRGEIPRTGGLERVVFNESLGELRRETLLTDLHQRVRHVLEGPDGMLYVLTDGDINAVLRITPTDL